MFFSNHIESDPVIIINVDNKEIYKNKIKRDCSKNYGVKVDKSNTYYLDKIIPPSSAA